MHHSLVLPRTIAAFGLFITSSLFTFAIEAKVEEQVLGPAPGNISTYRFSPTGVSAASLTMKGSRSLVVVNGVEGPQFDELLTSSGSPSLTCVGSVLFSLDGTTHVYAARVGDDYMVVRNGKEIYRGPYAKLAIQGGAGQLSLSPRGTHVSFLERVDPSASQHGWRLVVDGKPGPLSANNNSFKLFYSPDDSRWAYVAQKMGGGQSDYFTVVDGKEVAHLGHLIRFTSDNKMLVAAASPEGGWTLHSDGKVLVKGLSNGETKVWVASSGGHVATALRKAGGLMTLWIDGKEIAASEGAKDIDDVTFSPDGKHFIATCHSAASLFAIVDGKKGQDYRNIVWPQFTRDSSKSLYVAGAGSKNFLVADGQESEGFELIGGQSVKIAMPKVGSHFAYSTGDGMNRIFSVVVDTKPIALNNKSPVADSLAYSADGSRYAFAAADVGRSEINALFVDGQLVPNIYPGTMIIGAPQTLGREVYFIFSPDGKHIANYGIDTTTKQRGLYVDNKLVYATERGVTRAAFTPDSSHLVWASPVPGKGVPVPGMAWFVDGAVAVELPGYPLDLAGTWEMGADGVYQFATVTGNALKRFRITPSSDSNVDLMISSAAATQAKALADATAAKQKADDDALAAKQKAEADKAAAAAKAKADRDAAIAAKAKARQDAIDAKARARAK